MKNWQADLVIILTGSIWGFSFIFGRWGLEYCSPGLFLFLRFLLAAMVTFALFHRSIFKTAKKDRKQGLILGMLMGAGYLLQIYSLNFTDVARASFLTGMCLLGIPILNYIIFRDVIKANSLIGLILALLGLYILLDPSFAGGGSGLKPGDFMGLVGIIPWALYMIYLTAYTVGKEGKDFTYQYLFWQLVGVLPVALVPALILETGLIPPLHPDLGKGLTVTPVFLAGLFFNSILASVLTVLMHTHCQRHTTAIQGMICLQAEPITATVAAVFLVGEPMTIRVALGGAVVILAILVSELGGQWMAKKKNLNPL
jgi:drug/metabolite transporter (DMT)-like permease